MKLEFLKRSATTNKLILIFAGWGSDATLYRDVHMPNWDVAVVTGIDEAIPDVEMLDSYDTVYVYAWSLGVFVAEYFLSGRIIPTKAFAINGTPWPNDDTRGIPQAIFKGTIEGLNARSLHKFRVRMFGGVSEYKPFAPIFEHLCDTDDLRRQLEFVVASSEHRYCTPNVKWTAAYACTNDRIFPFDNQCNAWRDLTDIEILDGDSHYVDIQRIVTQTIIDVEKVGRRFSRSVSTYNAHAHAQRLIAETLAQKFLTDLPAIPETVIEIGPGTGLFTQKWSKYLKPLNALFIDLYEMPKYGVAQRESYFSEDAERVFTRLAAEQPGTVDAILSASAIQWFSDFELFFNNCAKVLKPTGYMAVSTFAPGNLEELKRLRPDYIRYLTAERLRSLLSEYFKEVIVVEDVVELEFTSPLEALRHLQLTGVTASGSRQAKVSELRRFANTFPMNSRGRYTLTFRPIYIYAKL